MKSQKMCDSKWPTWQVPELKKRLKKTAKEDPQTCESPEKTDGEPRKAENRWKNVVFYRLTPEIV